MPVAKPRDASARAGAVPKTVPTQSPEPPTPSPQVHTYLPLSPYALSVPSAQREAIGMHCYMFGGGALDTAKLAASWAQLLQAWPVLSASLLVGTAVPREASGSGSSKLGEQQWVLRVPAPANSAANSAAASAAAASLTVSASSAAASVRSITAGRAPADLSPSAVSVLPSLTQAQLRVFAPRAPRSVSKDLLVTGSASNDSAGAIQKPLVSAHITTFSDGALVVLAAPAVVLDAQSAAQVVRAWATLLHGGEGAPSSSPSPSGPGPSVKLAVPYLPRALGASTTTGSKEGGPTPATPASPALAAAQLSPLEAVSLRAQNLSASQRAVLPVPYGWHAYPFFSRALFAMRSAWSHATKERASSFKAMDIFVPRQKVAELMQAAREDLVAEGHDVDGDEGRVTETQVLIAWMLQTANKSKAASSTQLSVLVPGDLTEIEDAKQRAFLPTPYLACNSSLPSVPISQVPYATLLSSRLGVLALRLRYALESESSSLRAPQLIEWQAALAAAEQDGRHFFPANGDGWTFQQDWAVDAAAVAAPSATGAGQPQPVIRFTAALKDYDALVAAAAADSAGPPPAAPRWHFPSFLSTPAAGPKASSSATADTSPHGALVWSSSQVFSPTTSSSALGGRERWTLAMPRALPDGSGYWTAAVLPTECFKEFAPGAVLA